MFTSARRLVDKADIRVLAGLLAGSIFWFLLSAWDGNVLHVLIGAILVYGSWSAVHRNQTGRLTPDGKVVLITGCDSGIGFDLALFLDELGFRVVATCLRPDGKGALDLKARASANLHVLGLDVASDDSVARCLEATRQLCQGSDLWALINNAGINFLGDVELTTMKQYLHIANVNLFGTVRTTKAFLPLIRKAKGRIVNVTSVKGRFGLPSNAAYCLSKYGGETFSDMLRLEMYRFGVKVIIIEPGNFGGATGCLNEEGVKRIRGDLDEMLKEASEEVRALYGLESYLDQQFQAALDSARTTFPTTRPVMDACLDALVSLRPQDRYLIDGSNSLVDKYTFLARLKGILPDPWMDVLVTFFFGMPPLPGARRRT